MSIQSVKFKDKISLKLIMLICVLMIVGCVTIPLKKDFEGNFVEVARFGIVPDIVNQQLVINDFLSNSPAKLAGILQEDIIESINEKHIKNWGDYLNVMGRLRAGDRLSLTVDREGRKLSFELIPYFVEHPPTVVKIEHIVAREKREVSLAILVTNVHSSMSGPVLDGWENSIKNDLLTNFESEYLKYFRRYNYFSVVDRTRLNNVLREQKLGLSGVISDDLQSHIGQMTGASHILDISFTRIPSTLAGASIEDYTNARLIDIESGRVLAVDKIVNYQ